jgi:peptidoglycan-associated lipoprotein
MRLLSAAGVRRNRFEIETPAKEATMTSTQMGAALISFGLLALSGCAKKPLPAPPEPEPPRVELPEPTKPTPAPVDRRAEIQRMINEAFRPVYFPFDQATLSEESKNLLAKAGELMKREPGISVTIQGNADERGTTEYNLALGESRARVVQTYLINLGVPSSRLRILSYG